MIFLNSEEISLGKHFITVSLRNIFAITFLCFTVSLSAFSQNRIVSGIVKDSAGDELIGVSVLLKGTAKGTATDADGRYSILVTSDSDVLQFSYVGYKQQEIAVGSRSVLDIVLIEDNNVLDELVVVGYGTQKKSDLTGSVVSVKADDMNAIPTTSVAEMLRGQASGVVVTQNSARPGGGSDILIRGRKSITGSNAPLYIVDGVPVNNIDDFNSQDIVSVEILKDASAQSIYGARASNGVILVSTKRGAEDKTVIDFSGYVGIQQAKRNFDLYNGDEWAQLKREANRQSNGEYLDDASLFGNMYENLINRNYTDWEDLMIKDGVQQKYDLSVRSGNKNTKVAASIGYYNEKGMVDPAAYQRGNLRFNVDHKLSSTLLLSVNTNYTLSEQKREDENISEFITQSPLLNPYDENGNLVNILGNSKWNPAWNNKNMTDKRTSERLLLNMVLDWKIFKGLKYRMNASMNVRNTEQGNYLNSLHEKGSTTQGKAAIENSTVKDYLLENIFTYDYKINDKNNIDATFVQSINSMKTTSTAVAGYGFATDDLGYDNIGAASKTDPVVREVIPRDLLSYMGRIRYNLMDRYLFSVSARIDGSSVFGKNNKWGIFPAASFGWRLNEEDFMKDINELSNLKLRLSYGSVGNQAISPYESQGLVDSYYMQFGQNDPLVGYLPGDQLSNPDLKWETTTSLNAGLDFGLWKDRISGTIEYYHSTTKDLLMRKALNQISGYQSQLVNMGEVLNKGLEVSLNFIPVETKELSWNVGINFSLNKNEIVKLDGKVDENGKPVNDIANGWFVGYNIDAYYYYKFDGIWQLGDDIPEYEGSYQPQPGDIKIRDAYKDGKINDDDRVVMNKAPKWTGSVSSALKWKNIDFSFDFYTVQGVLKENLFLYDANSGGDLRGRLNGMKVDYWTPENPSNTAPRPRDGTIEYIRSLSFQDASYFRLRNISLGYTFPKRIIAKAYMSNLRIYASATNLWTQTDFLSYSPEISASGYPEPKTFVFGMNVSF